MKNIRIYFAVIVHVCCLNLVVSRADSWVPKTNFPIMGHIHSAGFMINDKIYIINGWYPSYIVAYSYMYDVNTNAWTQLANSPITGVKLHSCTINNYGYLGVTSYGYVTQEWWQYDPVANSWNQKASFPAPSRCDGVCFNIGSSAYIVSGTGMNDVWEYNSINDIWTMKNNAPWIKEDASCFVLNQKAYVIAGKENQQPTSDCWQYDPVTDLWAQKSDLPTGTYYSGISFSIGNRGFFGFGDSYVYNNFFEYEPVTDTWIPRNNNGATGFYFHCTPAFGSATKGYTGISKGGFFSIEDNWYEYTPDPLISSTIENENNNTLEVSYSALEGNLIFKNNSSAKNLNLKIYSTSGQLCYENSFANTSIRKIALAEIFKSKGLYFYSVTCGTKSKQGKILF